MCYVTQGCYHQYRFTSAIRILNGMNPHGFVHLCACFCRFNSLTMKDFTFPMRRDANKMYLVGKKKEKKQTTD